MRTEAMQQLIDKLSKSKKNGKESGFSLIELLVVVLIIGILAAIAVPVFLQQQELARASAVQSDLTTAKVALISCQASDSTKTFASCLSTLGTWGYVTSGGATAVSNDGASTFSGFCLKASTDTATPVAYFIGPKGGVSQTKLTACPA